MNGTRKKYTGMGGFIKIIVQLKMYLIKRNKRPIAKLVMTMNRLTLFVSTSLRNM